MKNKVLVKIILPELDRSYDIFLPVNEIVWKAKKLILKAISDLYGKFPYNNDFFLLNKSNGIFYNNNLTIINTDIRNGSELVLISCK